MNAPRSPRTTKLSPYTHAHSRKDIVLATVSGIASIDADMAWWFATHTPVKVITTKSIQIHKNLGNREPVITEVSLGSFGNAVGLRNAGVHACEQEFSELRARWPQERILNISIAGADEEEFATLAAHLHKYADALELNLSCPHAHARYGQLIGVDPLKVNACVNAVRKVVPDSVAVLAKLTPNTHRIEEIAHAILEGGADGIVAINTVGPYQYKEPHSNMPILTTTPWEPTDEYNPSLQGYGGMSGRWIKERAREVLQRVRHAVGEDVLLIGMGGVENHEDAVTLMAKGADIIGVGSALSLIHQRDWNAYLSGIITEETTTSFPIRNTPAMSFTPLKIKTRNDVSTDTYELVLDAAFDFKPGQSCFLWLPHIGEKPFAPMGSDPLSFLIAKKGPVTTALGTLHQGDVVYIRGPYGDGEGVIRAQQNPCTHAAIVCGGTGMALLPSLYTELTAQGTMVESWIGLKEEYDISSLSCALTRMPNLTIVYDEGTTGRVLHEVAQRNRPYTLDAWYTIGSENFMKASVHIAQTLNISSDKIFLSLEQFMLCGIGMCGACHHNGMLTCQYGNFINALQWLKDTHDTH